MVVRPTAMPILAGAALLSLTLLGACSAEFGGRCSAADECSTDRVCIQGYCLPADSPDGDGGMPDAWVVDGGEPTDGEPTDGQTADVALPEGVFGPSCNFAEADPVPQYDETFRPCADEFTAALWRFDADYEALAPQGAETPVRISGPNGRASLVDGGASNGAVRFNGEGNTRFVMDSPLWDGGPFTVELWARAVGHDTFARALVSNVRWVSRADQGGFEILIDRDDDDENRYRLMVQVPGRNAYAFAKSETRFPVGTWTHLAVTWDGDGELRLYVDGIEERVEALDFRELTEDLRIGYGFDDDRAFPGFVDELRISRVARDGQVLQKVAQGFDRPE